MQDSNPYAAPNAVVGDAQVTEQQLAGRGMRLVAFIIDTIILAVILIPVMLVGGIFAMVMSGEEPGFGTTLMISVASFVLFVIVQGSPLSAWPAASAVRPGVIPAQPRRIVSLRHCPTPVRAMRHRHGCVRPRAHAAAARYCPARRC